MRRFDDFGGIFGLLPTPYRNDLEINSEDLRGAGEFCCASGLAGIVWPVMVGEFYYLGERERAQNLDVILDVVAGRLPVVFGCSANSAPETIRLAAVASRADADAVIVMPAPDATVESAIAMFYGIAGVYEGPIILQNVVGRLSLSLEELVRLIELVPSIEYVKEEREPATQQISHVIGALGDSIKGVFGGFGGRFLPEELKRGARGCMPACHLADVLAKVYQRWLSGDERGARELHRLVLPFAVRESSRLTRYVLWRRGITSRLIEVQRGPGRIAPLDADDRRELEVLAADLVSVLDGYRFGGSDAMSAGSGQA